MAARAGAGSDTQAGADIQAVLVGAELWSLPPPVVVCVILVVAEPVTTLALLVLDTSTMSFGPLVATPPRLHIATLPVAAILTRNVSVV